MSPKIVKRVLKSGTSSVFIGGDPEHMPVSWRLDVREDTQGNRHFFCKRRRPGAERSRPKLFHYISAGGMRQLRRTSLDDIIEDRRRSFLVFLCLLAAIWVVFYFLPCV